MSVLCRPVLLLPGVLGAARAVVGTYGFFSPAAIEEVEKKVGFAVSEEPGSVFERYGSHTLQRATWVLLGILLWVRGWMPGISLTHPLPWQHGEQCAFLALPGAGEGDSPASPSPGDSTGAWEEL